MLVLMERPPIKAENLKDKQLIRELTEYLKLMHDSSDKVHGTYDDDFKKDCMVCLMIKRGEERLQ